MNAVKSVQLKYDKFANLPLGSPKRSHTMLFKKPNANVGNCIHIVLCVNPWSKHISLLLTDVTGCRQRLRRFRKAVCVYHPESLHMRSLL